MQIKKNALVCAAKHPLVWGCLLLTAITVLNNWPMAAFGFAWDDHGYVVRNYPIQDPVSLKSILWCLTSFTEANWHPMTWLALHIQYQFFGLNPGGYHVVNLLLHLANTVLLYALLFRTTRSVGKSLAVAALFSVHPLHIESVAWITEIKDVLSTFFFLLTLHAYTGYARRPGPGRYSLVCLSLACGLATKPMLVTAPFVLALLDYWPLGRWLAGPAAVLATPAVPRFAVRRLILEKLPLLAMSATVCVLAFMAQHNGGAVAPLAAMPMLTRLGNVANSYILYLWRMVWPWPLSFFYPLTPVPVWRAGLCLLGLTLLSLGVWRTRRSQPFLALGWLWYLGTLVPVIGFIQIGAQALADRYTYIPSIGVFIAVAWGVDTLRKRLHLSPLLPATLAVAAITTLMCVSLEYLLKWINEEELYSYGLTQDEKNFVATNNYGIILMQNNKIDPAIARFKKNIDATPSALDARSNLAALLLGKGDPYQALTVILPTLTTHPNHESPYMMIGQCFSKVRDEAIAELMFRKAINLNPTKLNNIVILSTLLLQQKRTDEALALVEKHLPAAYDKDPMKAMLLWCAGRAYLEQGKLDAGQKAFEDALRLQPVFPNARQGLARTALARGDIGQAVSELQASLRQYPRDEATRALLGRLYLLQGHSGKAYVQLKRAMSKPAILNNDEAADACLALATLARRLGRNNAAETYAARAHDFRTLLRPTGRPEMRELLFSGETGRRLQQQIQGNP
jgi:Tfp pilus assembly protein PilF